eukprot:362529-Chlamydomonas_euryale.AAC.1
MLASAPPPPPLTHLVRHQFARERQHLPTWLGTSMPGAAPAPSHTSDQAPVCWPPPPPNTHLVRHQHTCERQHLVAVGAHQVGRYVQLALIAEHRVAHILERGVPLTQLTRNRRDLAKQRCRADVTEEGMCVCGGGWGGGGGRRDEQREGRGSGIQYHQPADVQA